MAMENRGAAPTMLHIGCGNTRIEEFVNMDCRRTEATDLVAEAWDLDAFGDGSVEYLYSRHMLEHLSCADARRALTAWRRVLAADGILHVVVPDIAFHARQLLGLSRSHNADQEAHALAGFYGWQRDTENDVHRWGYTRTSLARLLGECGYTPTDDGIQGLIDRDREPWHINLRATHAAQREAA
jgi:predicted SAM-dependent methyltransferase